jgi:hypothetical protein
MAERTAYDEPSARTHRVAGLAPRPDRHRPGYLDTRVVVASCGLVIALIGLGANRPAVLARCAGCFGG